MKWGGACGLENMAAQQQTAESEGRVVLDEFRCASTGKPLYMPVVTAQGVAYSYVALLGMFVSAEGLPSCATTGEKIAFFPSVCRALHFFLLSEYKELMKARQKQDEAEMTTKFGFHMPVVEDLSATQARDDGLLQELFCAVTGKLAFRPCVLSSGTVVSASAIPKSGFGQDPDRLVACALHGQAPAECGALTKVLQLRFSQLHEDRKLIAVETKEKAEYACGGWNVDTTSSEHIFWGHGCDGCGMWPIRGDAWEDAECKDRAGFNLCDACHKVGFHKRVVTGKFGQDRLPSNKMVPMITSDFF